MESTNPYQAPDADLNQTPSLENDQSSPFSPKGRFGRLSYLAWGLLLSASFYGLMVLGGAVGYAISEETTGLVLLNAVILIASIPVLVFYIIFGIRRLHDFNSSGWWLLLYIVPLVNVIFGLIMIFKRGTEGANEYGPPRFTPTWEQVVGVIASVLYLLVPIAVFIAVAIPAYQAYIEEARRAAGG